MKDTFQENLLVAIREEVETREARPVRSHRRKWMYAAAATAVAAGVGVVGVPMLSAGPAYAVDREPDGSIRVHVTEDLDHDDLDALEAKLRFFGVNAEVDWLGNGEDCAEPRAAYVGDPDMGPAGLFESVPAKAPQDDGWDWIIHPEFVGEGRTLVWEVQVARGEEWAFIKSDIRVAVGPVAPCEIVPGPVTGDPELGN